VEWNELDIQIGQAGFGIERDILGSQNRLIRHGPRITTSIDWFFYMIFGDQDEHWLAEVEEWT
jgi:hypothetical protein